MADPRPGLIAAIRNHPGDDTARHVYADWCEEAGDLPRAEFIRAQIEAERLSPRHPRRGSCLIAQKLS